MDFIADRISLRLGGTEFGKSTELYKFEKIKRAKAEAAKNHPHTKLIDMGVGEPDSPADEEIVRILSEEAGKPENRFYADNGIPEFREAAAGYLKKVYGVTLSPHENILHGIGSKAILAMLPLCLINPGDITLTTVPGYPIIATHTRYLGGEVYPLPLLPQNNFYPDLDSIPRDILGRAKLLYINYPNNPTGQVATPEFFKSVILFAYRHNITIVHDAAYAALTYGESTPLSFLSLPGAAEVGVEIHSLSKAFNMTGWRLGFIAGNQKLIKAYGVVKDNTDSGQFRAIQKAAIYALQHPKITEKTCAKYSRRFDLLISALSEVGFHVKKPGGTFYAYVPAPIGTKSGIRFSCGDEAAEYLLQNALISTVPWDDAGAFLRFSVTFEAESPEEEVQLIEEMKKRLMNLDLLF